MIPIKETIFSKIQPIRLYKNILSEEKPYFYYFFIFQNQNVLNEEGLQLGSQIPQGCWIPAADQELEPVRIPGKGTAPGVWSHCTEI